MSGEKEGDKMYGCAPGDAKNGSDPGVRTTSVNMETDVESTGSVTVTGTSMETAATTTEMAATTTTSASASASKTAEPSKSVGRRLGVPTFVSLLVRGASGVGILNPVRGECCGGLCCKVGEVCARGTEGARCWPQAKRRDEGEVTEQGSRLAIEEARTLTLGEVQPDTAGDEKAEGSPAVGDKKGGGGGGGGSGSGGGGHAHRGGHHDDDKTKKNGAARPPIPTTLLLFLILFPSVLACLLLPTFNAAVHPRTIGISQIDPDRLLIAKQSRPLHMRWSCHTPRRDCGSGCWDPAKHVCCVQPDEKTYGLCSADQGQSCCGTMCCPRDTFCRNQDGYSCVSRKMKE